MSDRKEGQPKVAGTPGATRSYAGVRASHRAPIGASQQDLWLGHRSRLQSFPGILSRQIPYPVVPEPSPAPDFSRELDQVGLALGLSSVASDCPNSDQSRRVAQLPEQWLDLLPDGKDGANVAQNPQPHPPIACYLCGHSRADGIHIRKPPSWIVRNDWVLCEKCNTAYPRPVPVWAADESCPWVLPYDLFKRALGLSGRAPCDTLIDFTPSNSLKQHCGSLFKSVLSSDELDNTPFLGAERLVAYHCLETTTDVESRLDLLRYHLAPNGTLRLHLMHEPFHHAPRDVYSWLASKRLYLRHMPSQLGIDSLLSRMRLSVISRHRSPNLLVRGRDPFPEYLTGRKSAVRNAFRLGFDLWDGLSNCVLGEEIVLRRR